MKKIFLIIASCLVIFIIGLLIATNFIFITETIPSKNPVSINVYNKSIATLNNRSYESKDVEYQELTNHLNELGKISIFERLINGVTLNNQITQSQDNEYSKVISDVKKNNVCVELIYEKNQDKIIYIEGKTKVISYSRLLYVLPTQKKVDKVIVYFANDQTYETYNPLILNGKPEKLIGYINNL